MPSAGQFDIYWHQREYLIPIMNRGQVARFEILNDAEGNSQPEIWLDVYHKGVKCKFRVAQTQFMGVPQASAALVGTLVGFMAVAILLFYLQNIAIAALVSYAIGLTVLIPGAVTIKVCRKIRDWFVG